MIDVFDIIYNLCLEYEVEYNHTKMSLWEVVDKNIPIELLDISWNTWEDLWCDIYSIYTRHKMNTNQIPKVDFIKYIVGIALMSFVDKYKLKEIEPHCIIYLSLALQLRLNIISKSYFVNLKCLEPNFNVIDFLFVRFCPPTSPLKIDLDKKLSEIVGKLKAFLSEAKR